LINLIPGGGSLFAGWDSSVVRELAARAPCPVETFGVADDAQWRAVEIDFSGEMTRFKVEFEGRGFWRYRTPLAGLFNLRNCLGVIAACEKLGLDRVAVAESLEQFQSVKRRMQVRGVAGGVTVIDDFAHHPTAVRETLGAVRQRYAGRKIVAVFEPRSYTAQRKDFQQAFEDGLYEADEIIIAGLFHPERYTKETALSPEEMAGNLRDRGREAGFIPAPDEIVRYLAPKLKSGDVVVIMSNGSFGHIHDKLLKALGKEITDEDG
jgi:UDP-N-acetylmuramate: L-alanyl-gamma-D-glutamyl-meso-diaminopimelate ligase